MSSNPALPSPGTDGIAISLYISGIQRILKTMASKSTVRPKRILIIRTDRIGDVILTLPMAKVVKKHDPDAIVGMLVRGYTSELVEADNAVTEIIHEDSGGAPVPITALIRRLRGGRFDAAVHTHPRFRLALAVLLAGIPLRVGTGYRWYSFLFNRRVYEHRKTAERHELEYNLNLLSAIGFSSDGIDTTPVLLPEKRCRDRVRILLAEIGIAVGDELVILHPGSGGSARDWPPERFGRLAELLAGDRSRRVLITGGPGEEALVEEVVRIAGGGVFRMKSGLTLLEFGALAQTARLFIANSTGPLHLAAAVGTPVIGLYPQITALSPARWGPYTAKKTVLTPVGKPADCRLCRGGRAACECMMTISVDDVYRVALRQLEAETV